MLNVWECLLLLLSKARQLPPGGQGFELRSAWLSGQAALLSSVYAGRVIASGLSKETEVTRVKTQTCEKHKPLGKSQTMRNFRIRNKIGGAGVHFF